MTLPPRSKPSPIGTLICGLFVVFIFTSHAAESDQRQLTQERLATAMRPVKHWPFTTEKYSSEDWSNLVNTAKIIQQCDPNSVEKTLKDWEAWRIKDFPSDFLNATKVMLTLEVVFDLPENIQASELHPYSNPNQDGTFNLAWPIVWNAGRPGFAEAAPHSYNGAVYPASDLFRWYRSKYKLRDLSKFRPN